MAKYYELTRYVPTAVGAIFKHCTEETLEKEEFEFQPDRVDEISQEQYEYEMFEVCPICGQKVPKGNLHWVKDRYGIPFKKVCDSCYKKVKAEIMGWEFDSTYAGENLEEDY